MELREKLARMIEPNADWSKSYLPHHKRWHQRDRDMSAADRLIAAFPSLNQDNKTKSPAD